LKLLLKMKGEADSIYLVQIDISDISFWARQRTCGFLKKSGNLSPSWAVIYFLRSQQHGQVGLVCRRNIGRRFRIACFKHKKMRLACIVFIYYDIYDLYKLFYCIEFSCECSACLPSLRSSSSFYLVGVCMRECKWLTLSCWHSCSTCRSDQG
jgi:hypothetical protein